MSLANKNYIVFIESNTTGTGQLFISEAIKKGLNILFLTKNPHKYRFLQDELVQPVVINTENVLAIADYLYGIETIKAVISTSEYYVEVAAQVAQQLDLLHNDIIAINICRNKDKLYQRLREVNLAVPKSFRVVNEDEAFEAYKSFKDYVIVKPSTGSGSIGVRLCKTFVEVKEQVKHLLNVRQTQSIANTTYNILVQEYIDGDEYSVETISVDGKHTIIGITKKYLGQVPYFIEIGHDFPATCSEQEIELIESAVQQALDAIGFTWGPSHSEVRICRKEVYIIEINPRLAGGMIPVLVKAAKNIDLIKETISIYLGERSNLIPSSRNFASIRSLIATFSGTIKKLKFPSTISPHIYKFAFLKNEGDEIVLNGDYRDRLGFVITVADSPEKSIECADSFLKNSEVVINSYTKEPENNNSSIIKDALHPQALQIINKKLNHKQKLKDFNYFAKLDEAHLLMLEKCHIITSPNLKLILKEIYKLKEEKFASLLAKVPTRGSYLLYENELISRLGVGIAGKIHTGRSRNDLHETIFRLLLRENFIKIYSSLWRLRAQIISLAEATIYQPFPIYSQYQTALPGTFAHYLLSIEESLCRDQVCLQELFKFLNISPLGAGAGGGTSFPIDPLLTAKFLGFDEFSSNSLNAIASKDLSLRYLSLINIMGSTISRMIEDMQIWSTAEFKFVNFPDNLLGGSSMMPQKRNPYLLEEVKAKIAEITGYLTSAFFAINKTPFGNSYEIKAVLNNCVARTSELIVEVMSLTKLLIEGIRFNSGNILNSLNKNLTVATYASEVLAQNIYTIREAHTIISNLIYEAEGKGKETLTEIFNFVENKVCPISKDPIDWAYANEFGNGSGKRSVEANLVITTKCLNEHSYWYHYKVQWLQQAEDLRNNCVRTILSEI